MYSAHSGKAAARIELEVGSIVSAVVTDLHQDEQGTTTSYKLQLFKDGEAAGLGSLDASHLADHPATVEPLQDSIQVSQSCLLAVLTDPFVYFQTPKSMPHSICTS